MDGGEAFEGLVSEDMLSYWLGKVTGPRCIRYAGSLSSADLMEPGVCMLVKVAGHWG